MCVPWDLQSIQHHLRRESVCPSNAETTHDPHNRGKLFTTLSQGSKGDMLLKQKPEHTKLRSTAIQSGDQIEPGQLQIDERLQLVFHVEHRRASA